MAQKTPGAEDLMSVGTRISWGAIFAGGLLALAFHFLFSILGAAVGVTVSDKVSLDKLRTGALIWVIVTTGLSLFVGGMITSLFTVGENKVEAVLYGIIMWALLIALLVTLGATGVRAGMTGMVGAVHAAQSQSEEGWTAAAKRAGADEKMLADWQKQLAAHTRAAGSEEGGKATTTDSQAAFAEASKRLTWFTFAGIWISMLAAAAGAWLGAGPTFRIVRVVT